MAYSVEIINEDGLKFRFQEGECASASYNMNTKLLKVPIPEGDAEDQIIVNLGREKVVSFPFKFLNTATDGAAGTHSSEVKTVQEKLTYFDEYLITPGLEDLYTINIYSSAANVLSKKGIFESFNVNFTAEKPSILEGSISISIGGNNQV